MKKILLCCFAVILSSHTFAEDYKSILNGKRLVLEHSQCVGIALDKNPGFVNEIGNKPPCKVDMPARIKWVSDDAFLVIEKNHKLQDKPPRVSYYKVKSIKGKTVVLTDVWTGWGTMPDEDITYDIR